MRCQFNTPGTLVRVDIFSPVRVRLHPLRCTKWSAMATKVTLLSLNRAAGMLLSESVILIFCTCLYIIPTTRIVIQNSLFCTQDFPFLPPEYDARYVLLSTNRSLCYQVKVVCFSRCCHLYWSCIERCAGYPTTNLESTFSCGCLRTYSDVNGTFTVKLKCLLTLMLSDYCRYFHLTPQQESRELNQRQRRSWKRYAQQEFPVHLLMPAHTA